MPDQTLQTSRATGQNPGAPPRILLCNPGLDGHDRGIKVVARALRDHGMEVIYLPLRTTVEQVAQIAADEDVDVVGISNLSATLVSICSNLRTLLDEAGCEDIAIVAGGTIMQQDRQELEKVGIRGVFGPGSELTEIARCVQELAKARGRQDA